MAVRIVYEADYAQLIAAQEELNKLKASGEKVKGGNEKLSGSFGALGDQLQGLGNRFQIFGKGLGDVGASSVGAAKGVGGLTTGFKTLDTILKASVIGIIITSIVTLGVVLTKTAGGAKFLRNAMATLEGVFNGVVDVLINLDKIFSRNIVDVFAKNIKQTQTLSKLTKEYADNSRGLRKELGDLVVKQEELNQKADDATLSLARQQKAAKEAAKVNLEIAEKERKIARNNFELINTEIMGLSRRNELISVDLKDSLVEAEAAWKASGAAVNTVQLENAMRIRQIDQDTFEQRLDFLIDYTDNQKGLNERIIADAGVPLEKRFALLEETRDFTDKAFEKSFKMFNDQAGEQLDINMLLKESDADVVFNYLKGTELSEIETTRMLEFLRERKLFTQDLADAEKDLNAEKVLQDSIAEAARLDKIKTEDEAEDVRRAKLQDNADFELQLLNEVEAQKVNVKMMAADTALGIFNMFAKESKAAAFASLAIEKSLAIADVIITLQREKAAIAANAAANPLNAVTAGAAGVSQYATLATIAKIRAGLGITSIIAQGISEASQGFATGVIDLQGNGTGTSDSIPARLSRGESVMTALETRSYRPTLEAIRSGNIDADLLNSVSQGGYPSVIDATKVIHVPSQDFTLDENGFTSRVVKRGTAITNRGNRYKTSRK